MLIVMERIGAYTRRFSIVGELQHMQHILGFFFQNILPAYRGEVSQRLTHGIMVLLPSYSLQDWICFGERDELEFGRRGELVG